MVSESAIVHLAPLVVTIVLSVGMAVWLVRERRAVRGLRLYLVLVVVGGVLWQLQLVGLVLTTDYALAKFLAISEKFSAYLASFIWFLFVAEYTNSEVHHRRSVQAAIGAVIGGYVVLAVTNDMHGFFFAEFVVHQDPFYHVEAVRATAYFVPLVVTYGFVVLGVLLLSRFILETGRSARLRIALLAAGAFGVGTGNLASIVGLVPVPSFQYGGYGAFPFIVATTAGVFGLGLFELAPVARTTLVESLDDAVVVLDEEGRIADYNRRATDIWPGLRNGTGRPFETVCPDLAPAVELPETGPWSTQVSLVPDDQHRHYSVRVSPVRRTSGRGGVVGYSIILRDVTELERSRRLLEAKNDRLDTVASTVSHDLRNPLNIADGRADLLADALTDPDHLVHVEAIQAALDRMDDIIEDVLTLARHGDITDQHPVDLTHIAQEAWDTVETRNGALEAPDTHIIVADPSRLRTILENLFRNSVDHGGDDVTVTIEPTVDGFAVADDGAGIPEDAQDRIFDYGYTTHESGTGLGLSIVQTIADSHGWTVRHDPDHQSTRFVFEGVELADGLDPARMD